MSIETPKPDLNNSNDQYSDVQTPSAQELRESVHPDLKKSWIADHINTRPRIIGALSLIGVATLGLGAAGYGVVGQMSKQQEQPAPNDNGESILPGQEASAQPTVGVLEPSPKPTEIDKALEGMPITPVEKPETVTEVASAPFEIKSGQTPEALAKSSERQNKEVIFGGCNSDTLEESYNNTEDTIEEFSLAKAKELALVWAPVVYGPDYEAHTEGITATIASNARAIELYIRTNGGYDQQYSVQKVISSTTEGPVTTIKYEKLNSDNSSEYPNIVEQTLVEKQVITATFEDVEGKALLRDIKYING